MAAGPQRQMFRFPAYATGFRGLLYREGVTDEAFQGGFLASCTNLHLIGRGRLKKRKGHKRYVTALPSGTNALQGLAMYEFATTRHLIAVVNATIQRLSGSSWIAITGSLVPGTGQDNLVRFTQFSQGSNSFICGTGPNNTALWKWSGSGNAIAMSDVNQADPKAPEYATDLAEFYGRLWAVGTDAGNTITEYSDDGRADVWQPENSFHATRESPAVGLCRHNDGVLLIFHQHSIHRVEPVYDTTFGDPFGRFLVDNSVGAVSTFSIVNAKGATYFCGPQGPYRIRDPRRPAEYIGWPIEDYWASLNRSRDRYIFGFERGEPWNEVIWLVSKSGQSQNNAAIVYNPELGSWSVFEQSAGTMKFNCACNFVDSNGKEITICGGYNGIVSQAWGDDNNDTGNVDAGDDEQSVIQTDFETGAMEWGYPGLKRLREIWLDIQLSDAKTFTYGVRGIGDSPSISATQAIGVAGGTFGTFVFGTSVLGGTDPTQAKIIQSAKSRLFRFRLQESDDGPPYTLNALRFWWRPSGRRLKAIA